MEWQLLLVLLIATVSAAISSPMTNQVEVEVDGGIKIAKTDEHFICLTMDWWPRDKCSWQHCVWGGHASVLNVDLNNRFLHKAIGAFKNLRIRVGGTLQDKVIYGVGSLKHKCEPFKPIKERLFGYSRGCLTMKRWDELNNFFNQTGVIVTFGLNALLGRKNMGGTRWGGNWNYTNAADFIEYTVSKGYNIHSWEYGNELSGSGIGARVDASQYAKDLIILKRVIRRKYRNVIKKPLLVAPGGFFDYNWYDQIIRSTGPNVVNALTHHIYNLGAGKDPNLAYKILNPGFLSRVSRIFRQLENIIRTHGRWSAAWVGEAGGAFNSGGYRISDAFIGSFWYLDQLGMASKYNTKVYCRQALLGGHYGVLNTTTLIPTPDYYSALIWSRLMSSRVLRVSSNASPYLRMYAHCSKERNGVTLLLINLGKETEYVITIKNYPNIVVVSMSDDKEEDDEISPKNNDTPAPPPPPPTVTLQREEYHLTPKDGHVRSLVMLLNGTPLEIKNGEIPEIKPIYQDVNSSLRVAPWSIVFVVLPNFDAPACK